MSFERGIGNLIEAFTYIPHIELWLLGPVSDNSLMKLNTGYTKCKIFRDSSAL